MSNIELLASDRPRLVFELNRLSTQATNDELAELVTRRKLMPDDVVDVL